MNSKRGVSPLIATVLLIAFAVALGAVIMSWVPSQSTTAAVCENVDFGIEEIGGNANICYQEGTRMPGEEFAINTLQILASNQGSDTIDNVKLSIVTDSGDTLNPTLDVKLEPYESNKLSFEYKSNQGILRKVTIIPQIIVTEGTEDTDPVMQSCEAVVVQSVPRCQ